MFVIVELWKARPNWLAWSATERTAYLDRVAPAIRDLLADGGELVALGRANGGPSQAQDYDYWAIWRFSQVQQQHRFAETLAELGWHDYFEPVKVDVEGRALEEILARGSALA